MRAPRSTVFRLVLIALAAPAATGTAAGPASADVVELDRLTVDERGLGRKYLFIALPGFEILSPFPQAQTEAYAREFQRQRAMLRVFLPELATTPGDAPQAIFLDDQPPSTTSNRILLGREHLQNEGVLRQSLAAIRGVPVKAWINPNKPTAPAIAWSRAVGPDTTVFYTSVHGFNYQRQAANAGIGEADRGLGFIFPLPVLYEHRRPRWPAWLEDGIDGLGPRFLSEQTLQFFMLTRLAPPPQNFLARDLFSPDPRDPDPLAAETRRQAACVFVNWALLGDNPNAMLREDGRRETFWRFADRAGSEPVTEELFNDYFGFEAWSTVLAAWRRWAAYQTGPRATVPQTVGVYWPEQPPKRSDATARPATRAELVRIKSEYEWRIGCEFAEADPDLARLCLDQAGRRLRWAYTAGERDPQFLAVLALFEADAGSAAEARRLVDEAVATKVARPQLYLQQAKFRFEDERASLAGAEARLSPDQVRRVLEPLDTAGAQRPALRGVFEQRTLLWFAAAGSPDAAEMRTLAEGPRLFPDDLPLAINVAVLQLRTNDPIAAGETIPRALRFAAEGSEIRTRLLQLAAAAEKVRANQPR